MENNQVKLLTSLAQEIRTERKVKAKVVATLQSAKILTSKGNFTVNYPNLSKVTPDKK